LIYYVKIDFFFATVATKDHINNQQLIFRLDILFINGFPRRHNTDIGEKGTDIMQVVV